MFHSAGRGINHLLTNVLPPNFLQTMVFRWFSSGAKLWIVSLQRYKNTKFVHFVWKLKIIEWSFKQISFVVFIFPCCLQHIRFFICDIVKTANMMPDYFSNYKVVRCSKLLKSSLWRLEHCFHVTMWMKNMLCKLLIA